jgi:N-formylglutamate amidohydrolase
MAKAMAVTSATGLAAAANDPFAGGHIVDRHGRPQAGVHAIQVEIDRRFYLTQSGEPGERFDDVAALLETLAVELGEDLLSRRLPAAAE